MDHKDKRESMPQHESDPFRDFMFGKRVVNDDVKQEDVRKSDSKGNDDWLFGRPTKKQTSSEEKNTLNDFLSQIDTEKLMENVDLFLETSNELKPLWKKISPYLQKFKK